MEIQLQKLILIFIRITAFIVICPGFSFKGLPNIIKIALSFGLSMIIYAISPELELNTQLFHLGILTIKEVLFGLALGYVTNLIFSTVEMAGQLIDFQVGFSMAAVFDPSMGSTVANYGRVYYWLSIALFFILNMHHHIINTLIQSFEYVPITTVDFGGLGVHAIIRLFALTFELAINLAAPVLIVVLVTDVVLGIISRTVPQINVLMLGMPLKSMISFIFSLITLSWLTNSMGKIMASMSEHLSGLMNLF